MISQGTWGPHPRVNTIQTFRQVLVCWHKLRETATERSARYIERRLLKTTEESKAGYLRRSHGRSSPSDWHRCDARPGQCSDQRERERGIRPSVCLYAGPVCHPRGRDGLGGPRGQFISDHSLFCGYLGGSQLQLHRRQQLVPNGDRGLLGQWFKCLQYPGGSGGPLDHLLFLPPVLGTVEALWRTDRSVTLENLLSNITTVSFFFLTFDILIFVCYHRLWNMTLQFVMYHTPEPGARDALHYDTRFWLGLLQWCSVISRLMEIFAKHKTSSVFLKVEFGLKKLITSVVIKNSKELRFNEKKLRLSIFKIEINSFIIFK